MQDLADKLGDAESALERDDHRAALAALVDAWAATRHPRIAEIAQRVSLDAGKGLAPIQGKTVRARIDAWLELEARHDLADVDRLLAIAWPGKWKEGLEMLERIVTWPDDPRVARALARLLHDPPYTSQASYAFGYAVQRRLFALEDPRSLPAIDRYFSRWRRATPEVEALRAKPLFAFDERAESALARLEQRFASERRSEGTSEKTAQDFLDAIWAAPEDRALKTVFADWLMERGDPRGELIALGCARADGAVPGKDAERRERALVAKVSEDVDAWDWPVAKEFKKGTRRYEEGFFVGGRLLRVPELGAELHPAWSLVRIVELEDQNPRERLPFFERPELRSLRAIYNIAERAAAELAQRGGLASIETLEIVQEGYREHHPYDPAGPLTTCTGATRLRSLGVCFQTWGGNDPLLEHLPSWPLMARLSRVMFRNNRWRHATSTLASIMENAEGPSTVEVRSDDKSFLAADDLVVFRREGGRGPFREIVARAAADEVTRLLGQLPEGSLDAIALDLGRTPLRVEERRALDDALARFPRAKVDPPLGATRETPAAVAVPEGPVVDVWIWLRGMSFLTPERLERALSLAGELGIGFDSYSVGYNSTHRKLGPKPVERLAAWTKKKTSLDVYRDGTNNRFTLDHASPASSRLEASIAHDAARTLVPWMKKLLEGGPSDEIHAASVVLSREHIENADPFRLWGGWPGWLLVVTGRWFEWLRDEALASLRSEPLLAGLFFERTSRHLLVALTPSALEPPTSQHSLAFAEGIRRIVQDEWARRRGYRWDELGRDALGAVASVLGVGARTDVLGESFKLTFASADGTRRLAFYLQNAFAEPTIDARLEADAPGAGFWTHELGTYPAGSQAEAKSAFLQIARIASESGPAWLANPEPPAKKRR